MLADAAADALIGIDHRPQTIVKTDRLIGKRAGVPARATHGAVERQTGRRINLRQPHPDIANVRDRFQGGRRTRGDALWLVILQTQTTRCVIGVDPRCAGRDGLAQTRGDQ